MQYFQIAVPTGLGNHIDAVSIRFKK